MLKKTTPLFLRYGGRFDCKIPRDGIWALNPDRLYNTPKRSDKFDTHKYHWASEDDPREHPTSIRVNDLNKGQGLSEECALAVSREFEVLARKINRLHRVKVGRPRKWDLELRLFRKHRNNGLSSKQAWIRLWEDSRVTQHLIEEKNPEENIVDLQIRVTQAVSRLIKRTAAQQHAIRDFKAKKLPKIPLIKQGKKSR